MLWGCVFSSPSFHSHEGNSVLLKYLQLLAQIWRRICSWDWEEEDVQYLNCATISKLDAVFARSLSWYNGPWMCATHSGTVWVVVFAMHDSFSSTDLKFCSCSDDTTVKVWDFARCQEERSLAGTFQYIFYAHPLTVHRGANERCLCAES